MLLSNEQILAYEKDGFLAGLRVYDPENASRIKREFDHLESREGREKCQSGVFDPHFKEKFVWDIATSPAILDRVEALIGSDILLMGSHFFCKYGPTTAYVAWHQDVTYWGLDPSVAISAWYAVDGSDADNGCMQVIPGSHLEGVRPHTEASTPGNLLSVNQDLELRGGESERVTNVELKAGEISFHSGLVIHGSPPNKSDLRRCGLAMIYLPACVKQVKENSLGERWKAIAIRGSNEETNLDILDPPFPLKSNRPVEESVKV